MNCLSSCLTLTRDLFSVPVVATSAKNGAPTTKTGTGSTPAVATSGKSYNQPDLVKVSSPGLEQTLQRENSQLRERLGHSAKGFTAMAVALNHVTKEVRRNLYWVL